MLKPTTRDQGKKKWRKSLFDVACFIIPPYEADITHTSWQMHVAIKAYTKMKWTEHSGGGENEMRTWENQSRASVNHCAARNS